MNRRGSNPWHDGQAFAKKLANAIKEVGRPRPYHLALEYRTPVLRDPDRTYRYALIGYASYRANGGPVETKELVTAEMNIPYSTIHRADRDTINAMATQIWRTFLSKLSDLPNGRLSALYASEPPQEAYSTRIIIK